MIAMGYSHISWACPFYRWDERLKVHCGKNRVVFQDRDGIRNYAKKYCASPSGWSSCTLAQSLIEQYERNEKNEKNEKHRQDQNA